MSLPQPYASIKLLDLTPFGYYGNTAQIAHIFETHPMIRTALEIGSWIGVGSTFHIGNLLKERGGKLYAVDTWLGSSTQQPGREHYEPFLKEMYQLFLSNMIHLELTDVVVPIRMRSLEAAKALNVTPDLIYIDGEHTYDAVYEDMTAWYPFVQKRGILCGDDWTWESVKKAVVRFAEDHQLKIAYLDNFWLIQE
jgi:hypothetical protein